MTDDDVVDVLATFADRYDPTDEDGEPIDGLPASFWATSFVRHVERKHPGAVDAARRGSS